MQAIRDTSETMELIAAHVVTGNSTDLAAAVAARPACCGIRCKRRGRPRVAMELGNAEAISRLVAAGLGGSIASAVTGRVETRAGTLIARPLAPPLRRRLAAVSRRRKAPSPALEAVLAALGRAAAG